MLQLLVYAFDVHLQATGRNCSLPTCQQLHATIRFEICRQYCKQWYFFTKWSALESTNFLKYA